MGKKEVFEIKHQSKPLAKTVDVAGVIGKHVIAKNGKKLGTIESVRIHPTGLTVEGIKVRRGMFEVDDYIGREYIRSLTPSGAVLKIVPVREIMGLEVYDANGQKIGKVKAITRSKKTNSIAAFVVERGFMKQDATFSGKDIKEIGKGVLLKVPFKG